MPSTEYALRSAQALSGKPFALRLPDSIQRAVVARVDRLPVDLQVVLKASSVIGTAFLLRAVATLLVFDNGGPTPSRCGSGSTDSSNSECSPSSVWTRTPAIGSTTP
jgi:hypothetical protein